MSTNIEIERICEYCKARFTARTLVTRYCSHLCNRRHYKKQLRDQKVATAVAAQKQMNEAVLPDPGQELLEIDEAAAFMRISRSTLFRLIEQGKLKRKKVLSRTFIRKKDIIEFFNQQ